MLPTTIAVQAAIPRLFSVAASLVMWPLGRSCHATAVKLEIREVRKITEPDHGGRLAAIG